jgi:hypothetical protein
MSILAVVEVALDDSGGRSFEGGTQRNRLKSDHCGCRVAALSPSPG